VHVAEQPGIGWAGIDAGRTALGLGNGFVVDAVNAQGAFGHHAAIFVVLACAVGAGPGAVFAADAFIAVNENDAVLLAFV
jgi:hypothetical protein